MEIIRLSIKWIIKAAILGPLALLWLVAFWPAYLLGWAFEDESEEWVPIFIIFVNAAWVAFVFIFGVWHL
jgi:hypothetical protein